MSKLKKPNCPICGSEIELVVQTVHGVGASSSVALGGYNKSTFYRCKANFQVCSESISIANAWFDHWKKYDFVTKNGSNWREALVRYHHYCDFMSDNQRLKYKLNMLMDESGMLPNGSLEEEYPQA